MDIQLHTTLYCGIEIYIRAVLLKNLICVNLTAVCLSRGCGASVTTWVTSVSRVPCMLALVYYAFINTLRPRQNVRHFADDTFKPIFLNENIRISIQISLVPKVPINNIPALVQIMAWRRPGDKPLSEPIMVYLLTHICVTRPQWVKSGPWFNMKMSPCQYRKSHCGDKTVVRSSYLHNGISYTGKMISS